MCLLFSAVLRKRQYVGLTISRSILKRYELAARVPTSQARAMRYIAPLSHGKTPKDALDQAYSQYMS
jgi:hypothetical protein